MTLRARPPGKLNLSLAVEPRGEDGYHPLRSVFARIGLADELVVEVVAGAAADELVVSGPVACPIEGNLVLRAFALLRSAVGQTLPPLRATLAKHIPLGAGLGGGSSDGAAALELARRMWGIGLAPALAAKLELELGADVPFFARNAPLALVEGRGERERALPGLVGAEPAGVLLCASDEGLATAGVYRRFDELGGRSDGLAAVATDALVEALGGGLDAAGVVALAPALRDANELWPAAASLMPGLATRRDWLEGATDRPWLLTGSGPTLFALYASLREAEAASNSLAEAQPAALAGARLIATQLDATEARSEP